MAVLTLGLGIGATTALFSVVNAWLLRPLPFHQPDHLVVVWETVPSAGILENTPAPASFAAWQEHATSFAGLAAWSILTTNLTGAGDPVRLEAIAASADLLPVLGVSPRLGRNFTPEETRPGADAVALISHGFWRSQFGGAHDAVGRRLMLDGRSTEVIGVLPESLPLLGFSFDVWRPLLLDRTSESRMLWVFGRLRPGVSLEQASAEVSNIGTSRPGSGMTARVAALHEQTVGSLGQDVLMLFAATALVLLIACANVASLTLARLSARQQELVVRSALGASRTRIAAQILIESLALGAAGGGAGLLITGWAVKGIVSLAPRAERLADVAILEPRVFVFALGASTLTAMLFGIAPAMQAVVSGLGNGVRLEGRGVVARRHRLLSGLVVAEIALALALLSSAGLVLRGFVRLSNVELGFSPEGLLVLDIPRPSPVAGSPGHTAFYTQLEERLAASAGVRGVALSQALPLRSIGSMGGGFVIEGRTGDDASTPAYWRIVNADYFRTMQIPLKQGRTFTPDDREGSPAVAIVSESFAKRAWPGERAVDRRIGWGNFETPLTVVGVAADIRHSRGSAPGPHVYMPFAQVPAWSPSQLALRSDRGTAAAIDIVRAAVRGLDPDQPLAGISTGEALLSRTMGRRRFQLTLVSLFAGLAAVLALVGIYGVMSFVAGQAGREMGIRLALGATPSQVRWIVLRQGLLMTAAGLALGLALTRFGSGLLEGFVVGVTGDDLLTPACAAALLSGAALLACVAPARRASNTDPLVALRTE